jgi:hypothetical protein
MATSRDKFFAKNGLAAFLHCDELLSRKDYEKYFIPACLSRPESQHRSQAAGLNKQ